MVRQRGAFSRSDKGLLGRATGDKKTYVAQECLAACSSPGEIFLSGQCERERTRWTTAGRETARLSWLRSHKN